MADYDCCNPRSTTSTSLGTAVSMSQALPTSTSESMWEGWAQTSLTLPTRTEQLQQQLGADYNRSTSKKNGISYQHDLLSSWLMSGYQTVGLHQQHQHGGEEGSGTTTMYRDEFSRMNICSSTSSDYNGVASTPAAAAAGGSDGSHHFYDDNDVMQTCSSSVQTGNDSAGPTEVRQLPAQFLNNPTLDHNMEAAHKLDVNANLKLIHQMNGTTGLSSRASSSSPPSGSNSYGQTMQQHRGVQLDSRTYWASAGSTAAVTSSSPQPSDCGGGGMRSSGQQQEDQQPNTSCDSIILHHQQHQTSREECEGNDFFHISGTDLTSDQMYTELRGLVIKNMETPPHSVTTDHHLNHQLAICSDAASAAARSYGDHSSWTQFNVSAGFCTPSSHGEEFTGIQEVLDPLIFESSTPDSLSTATHTTKRKHDTSPSSSGTTMSTIHYFNAAAGAAVTDLTHPALPYRSSPVDLDSPESLQRKRPLSRGTEQVGDNGVSSEDSVKRSCIVRCLWEQNIAQLQLANSSFEHQPSLWQLQSQARFGSLPNNFLIGGGGSSNSGSMDMSAAVGPALNTNGRPRARRGSATDPQSVYARHRRERINDRLKVLQHLVPNGAKVDIVAMLEDAINYVKFLQLQVRLLSSDELWIYTPTTYNGVDVSMGVHGGLLNQQTWETAPE